MPKPGTKLANLINQSATSQLMTSRSEPLWLGPESEDEERGGITQSMIASFLVCRERFRLKVIEGLRPEPRFETKIHFGNMWHVCEEHLAAKNDWETPLLDYAKELAGLFFTQREEVDHWYNVCKTQFPVYVDFWSKHPDVKNRTPLMQEQVFHIPYDLPSGKKVWLRGKYDSVDLITEYLGKKKVSGIYLQENKTKSKIVPAQLQRQLKFDLQTMMYLLSLRYVDPALISEPVKGVRYNVIRRDCPIRRAQDRQLKKGFKAGESKEVFYGRLKNDYFLAEPENWFMRWKTEVTTEDMEVFKRTCLNPILQNVCEWYERITSVKDPWEDPTTGYHWRHPFGIYNILNEGGNADTDEYMDTGSTIGLTRVDTLFTELKSA